MEKTLYDKIVSDITGLLPRDQVKDSISAVRIARNIVEYFRTTESDHLFVKLNTENMKRLLDDHQLKNNTEYYDRIHENYINGNRSDAADLFDKMPKKYRKECFLHINFNTEKSDVFNFFFNLI